VGVPRDTHAVPPPALQADADGPAEMHDLPAHPAGGESATTTGGRAGARERKAFTRLILEHDERLRGLAYRLLGDRELMEEALQEAYAKAFVGLPGFRRRSSAGTWLYRITYTTCIDVLRRQRRLVALPDGLLDDAADPAPDPGDEVAERERLSTALAALPPEQRAAVLLVDRDGFDYKTVAEILDVPFGTAASRVSAARHALRRALGPATAEE
jgi:RNA polymerase sigma-70 factor (ECF subfamily)